MQPRPQTHPPSAHRPPPAPPPTHTDQGCPCEGWGASAVDASGSAHAVFYNNANAEAPASPVLTPGPVPPGDTCVAESSVPGAFSVKQ